MKEVVTQFDRLTVLSCRISPAPLCAPRAASSRGEAKRSGVCGEVPRSLGEAAGALLTAIFSTHSHHTTWLPNRAASLAEHTVGAVRSSEWLADARWALRWAVSFERINMDLNNSAIHEFRRRDDALIAIALELIQPGPICR